MPGGALNDSGCLSSWLKLVRSLSRAISRSRWSNFEVSGNLKCGGRSEGGRDQGRTRQTLHRSDDVDEERTERG